MAQLPAVGTRSNPVIGSKSHATLWKFSSRVSPKDPVNSLSQPETGEVAVTIARRRPRLVKQRLTRQRIVLWPPQEWKEGSPIAAKSPHRYQLHIDS
jgi:hypothetical protein